MSLKVWIPFIKNFNNQGTEIVNPTNSGATASTAGPLGNSYSFDGTNDQVITSYTCAEAEYTVCLWVTFTKLNVHLVDMRNSDGVGYQPFYVNSSSGIQVGGSNSSYIYINFVPSLNTWYHLCVRANSSRTQLFVNGEYYGETTSAVATNFNRSIEIHIGSRYSGANWFGGNVADFRLYNEYLSNYEIKNIARGLLVHYAAPFTGTANIGDKLVDSSGFGRDATLYNGNWSVATFTKSARYGKRWNTSTNSGYAYTTSPSASAKTVSFWIATPKTVSTVFFADYKSKLAFGFNGSGYIIPTCDSLSIKMFSSANISASTLTHIVIRKNSAGTDVDLFVNGTQVTTRYTNNYWTHSSDTLMIGQRSTGTPMPSTTFADFRMYATILSDTDIKELYNTQLKQFSNGKSSPFELYEDTVGKVQVTKGGLLINNSFNETSTVNKFKSTSVISKEFIER